MSFTEARRVVCPDSHMAKAPAKRKSSPPSNPRAKAQPEEVTLTPEIRVRRMHRRDLRRVWEFLKLVFRSVNRKTLEYQRPRSRQRFEEVYDDEGIEQLVFEVGSEIVGYAECAYEVTGSDNWINPRFFDARDMRPLFVEELASHPNYQGRGVGSFMLEQLRHLARVRGCTHLVLEVAENNVDALRFYRKRSFQKLDAAIFLAQKVDSERELLPPRQLVGRRTAASDTVADEPGSLALSAQQTIRPLRKASSRRTGGKGGKAPLKRTGTEREDELPRLESVQIGLVPGPDLDISPSEVSLEAAPAPRARKKRVTESASPRSADVALEVSHVVAVAPRPRKARASHAPGVSADDHTKPSRRAASSAARRAEKQAKDGDPSEEN